MGHSLVFAEEVTTALPKKLYADILRETLAASGHQTESGFRFSEKKVTLNAVAVSEKKIQELNKTYRGRDEATDILSFGDELSEKASENPLFLGELFFAPAFIRRQARADERPYRQSMIYIFSHGILHLLGYDHTREMFAYQDQVTAKLFSAPGQKKKPLAKKQ